MNWLIIASTVEDADKVSDFLNNTFENLVINKHVSGSDSFEKTVGILNQITNCVVLNKSLSNDLVFITGYLCGRKVPVYTEMNEYSKSIQDCDFLYILKDCEGICKEIEKNKESLILRNKMKEAFDYLYDNGFPFTAGCFAENIALGKEDICKLYVLAGMNVNSRDNDGTSMINIACRAENLELVKWLVNEGAEIDPVSEDRGYTPLMDAVWKGNLDIAKFLVEKGADVNKLNKEGQTMIVLAVGADKIDLCRLLAENGADVDIPDQMGMSAYGYAQLFGKTEILSILEKYHKE